MDESISKLKLNLSLPFDAGAFVLFLDVALGNVWAPAYVAIVFLLTYYLN